MKHQFIACPLLALCLILSACHSYTRFRPKVDTMDTRSEAQVCIADCRDNTSGKNEFHTCLRECPSLVTQEGRCNASMLVCEEAKDLNKGKTALGTAGVVLLVVGAVALTAVLLIVSIPRS